MKNRKVKISLLLIATLIVSSGVYVILANVEPKNNGIAQGIQELSMVRPAFAQSMDPATTLLSQEAGMAIWLNATSAAPLSLADAQNAMVNIENVTSTYVVGSVSLQSLGFTSDDWPHCIVFQSGWVVVYYLKVNTANPPSTAGWVGETFPMYKDAHWNWYDKDTHTLNDNLLHKALALVCSEINGGISVSGAQYYHFQYPSATTLEIAIKTATTTSVAVAESFNINVPNVTIDEASYSFYAQPGGLSISTGATVTPIVTYPSYGSRLYGPLPAGVLSSDVWHTVTATSASYGTYATGAIIILYH